MVQHIVLLKLKPGTSDEEVRAAFAAGENLSDEIPGLVEFGFGRDRSNPDQGFSLASVLRFEDEDALRTYLDHPLRTRYIAEHVDPITEERIEIDVPTEGMHRPTATMQRWLWGGSSAMLDDT
jgi:quinol monooxygenase YgiN